MAKYERIIITQKGQELMAKMMMGIGNIQYNQIITSSKMYTMEQLEDLSELEDIKQRTFVNKVTRTNAVTIKVEGAMNNTELTEGYFSRTVGITAIDPDVGEILYGVTIVLDETKADYIPPFNNTTITSVKFELIISVGNSSSVTLEVNPAAAVTVQQLNDVVEHLEAEIASGGGSASIPISPSEPENWNDGEWWFEDLDELEPESIPIPLEITTIPFDDTKPFHLETDGTVETLMNVTDNEETATVYDLIIT